MKCRGHAEAVSTGHAYVYSDYVLDEPRNLGFLRSVYTYRADLHGTSRGPRILLREGVVALVLAFISVSFEIENSRGIAGR